MNVALIGHGRWGKNIERTLRSFDDVSLVVVEKGAESPASLDAVLIATPSVSHADVALPFIEKRIATFIEKPLATTIPDAQRIEAAAKLSGALVFVGHIHLYNPAFETARALLPQLGKLQRIEAVGMNNAPRSDSSVLWDWLPHDLAIAHALCGEALSVKTLATTTNEGVYDSALVEYRFRDVVLTSDISWRSPEKRKLWRFVGEKGELAFDDIAPQKLTLRIGDSVSHPAYDAELPLTRELRAFLKAVRDGVDPLHSLMLGVSIVKEIAAAESSAAQSGATILC